MKKINTSASVHAPIQEVWEKYTQEEHIVNWNFASEDWHCPASSNDLKVGGKFSNRMEAKDGSFGFAFEGTYTAVEEHRVIDYVLDDGRSVEIRFEDNNDTTMVHISFVPEQQNPLEMQQQGWQSILNIFKDYVEKQKQF